MAGEFKARKAFSSMKRNSSNFFLFVESFSFFFLSILNFPVVELRNNFNFGVFYETLSIFYSSNPLYFFKLSNNFGVFYKILPNFSLIHRILYIFKLSSNFGVFYKILPILYSSNPFFSFKFFSNKITQQF